MNPLSIGLNIATQLFANVCWPRGWDLDDDLDVTYEMLCAEINSRGRMTVWTGGSDHTIYASPKVNYAARAWHDWVHWKHGFDFGPVGEFKTFREQQRMLRALYGDAAMEWCAILHCEIVGQLAYCEQHGDFPANQMGFTREWLSDGPDVALANPAWLKQEAIQA